MLRSKETQSAMAKCRSRRRAGQLIITGTLLIVAAGSSSLSVKGPLGSFSPQGVEAQNQTQSTSGNLATVGAPPESLTAAQANSGPASPGRQVSINFDELPVYTAVTNQYPDAFFSTDSSDYVIATPQNYGTSLPNISRASRFGFWFNGFPPYNHFAPLVVDFPRPVNDLAFHMLAADNFGVIAQLDIYQNGRYTRTEPVFGHGSAFVPVWLNLAGPDFNNGAGYSNVTRIEFQQITDTAGLAFDNFNFTVPSPTPTPTPTPLPSPSPTPPQAPTNVKATPDEAQIFVSWQPSSGANSYVIKRVENVTSTGATAPESLTLVPINPAFTCNGVSVPCVYTDPDLNSDVTYTYTIAATNVAGTSGDSASASGKPLPKPGCRASATPTPGPGSVSNFGWTMQYGFTSNDGLVISEINLNGKRMAKQMSVPYFRITTYTANNPNLVLTRGELTPAGTISSMRSRLTGYKINPPDPNKILIEADYAIDQIPGTPGACLNITQKYEFYRDGASPPELAGPCEPSDTVHPCDKFRPMIEYSFHGGSGEFLSSLNTPIRLHFQNTVTSGNTVALTRDFDRLRDALAHPVLPFRSVFNPLMNSWHSQVIVPRSPQNADKNAHTVDNFHQTNDKISVILPGLKVLPTNPPIPIFARAGCVECVHFHWRWSSFLSGPNFRNGIPIVPPGSDQAVDIQVNPFKNVFENFHPTDYYQLFNPNDALRNPAKGVHEPYDVVLWYSPTGFATSDTFFWHTAFFTPLRLQGSNTVSVEPSSDLLSAPSVQDGPVSVSFGGIYEPGTTSFSPFDLTTVPPLPAGYAALNNAGYVIDTTAVVAGPHVVNFSAASVMDQTAFNNLRIFQAEPDAFDPEKPVWVDATILPPDTPAPDFSAKTLSARSDRLGLFVIGKLVQSVPPPGVANLRVSSTDSSDPITAGNDLTYTVTVTNDGPQTATEVALKNQLSPDVTLTSATATQGTCKVLDGVVYCSLNSLTAGSSATVTLVVQPTEGTGSFPPEGKMIANTALVRAKENDTNPSNDWVTEQTKVLPSPNKPPVVNITTPLTATMFVAPASITINAVATDTDGAIAKVDFFDNDELIGTGTPGGGNSYSITKTFSSCTPESNPCGSHTLIAVATDNGGRQNVSSPVEVILNGPATVNITSPASGTLANPSANITLASSASHPSGILSKVEFFANQQPLGQGTANGTGQYSLVWSNVPSGIYSIVAVATDGSGVRTTSAPVNLTVAAPPTVTISTPVENTVFPSLTNISVSATAQSARGSIIRVDFYAGGVLIGSASDVGTDKFTATWRHVADGFYSLTAIATDSLGVTTTSSAVHIAVNAVPTSGELVWFDDALPAGATKFADGDGDWYWVDANPGALSGTKSHQSRNFAQLDSPNNSFHQHAFNGATAKLPVNAGDKLFTYLFLDINNMPREIMLQWNDGNNWEHRAYWGENRINYGINGTASRRYMGSLPKAGQWVRLEVPANLVGLENTNVSGMAFTLDGGRATWDLAGKTTANAPPPPTPSDFVWVDDAIPAGSIPETIDDQWQWLPPHFCGAQGHRSLLTANNGAAQFRSHSFRNASTTMNVQPGDVLFTYVFLDGNNMPDELVLQWHDGSSWEHRAYWGRDFFDSGTTGTESRRFMGGMPPGNQWYRLEVPASYVGLEGKTVSGMAFGFYSLQDHAGINWDCAGKSSQLARPPQPLSSLTPVWRLYNTSYGWVYNTNDILRPDQTLEGLKFYVHPNQAAATVPFYRFRNSNRGYFYSRCQNCTNPSVWTPEGIAFYVYADGSTPGTVPLHLFHDVSFRYFLTTDYNEGVNRGLTYDAIWAYVFATNPLVSAAPHLNLLGNTCGGLYWFNLLPNVTGFKIERRLESEANFTQIAMVGPEVDYYSASCSGGSGQSIEASTTESAAPAPNPAPYFRIKSTNPSGDSAYSNEVRRTCFGEICTNGDGGPPNNPPSAAITSPADGDTVGTDFTITANVFDVDGNGTIARVEFFQGSTKIGEAIEAPYSFAWNNVAPGSYVLTARATDTAGAATTSSGVSVTVSQNPPVFSDDFNDNWLDPSKWAVIYPQGTPPVTEQSQQLQITLAPNTAGYNGVVSTSTFDLTGRTAQVEVAQIVSQAGWSENFMEVALDEQNYYLIDVGGGSLLFRSMVNGVNDQFVIGYDPAAFPYWRIRHDPTSNTINLETSSDGTNWTTRKTVTATFSLTAVKFYLMAGAWGTGNGSPGAAKYDNFQLLASSPTPANSGFEIPSLGAGGFQYSPAGGAWSFVSGAGVSRNSSPFTAGNPPAPEGSQVAFLQGGSTSFFSQSVSGFQSGISYTITFSAAQRGNCCGAGGQDFQVFLDSDLLGTFRPASTNYATFTTPAFTTTTGAHTLKFVGLDSSGGDNTAFIDQVRIAP